MAEPLVFADKKSIRAKLDFEADMDWEKMLECRDKGCRKSDMPCPGDGKRHGQAEAFFLKYPWRKKHS